MTGTCDQPMHIVLIDDDEVDAEAVARLLQRQRGRYRLTTFPDACSARDALSGDFGGRLLTQRYLILLDLNMPRMTGFEFLDWLRSRPGLLRSIVFVFTTSETASDCVQAYDRQVAGYLAKAQLSAGYRGLLPLLTAFCASVTFPPPRKATS